MKLLGTSSIQIPTQTTRLSQPKRNLRRGAVSKIDFLAAPGQERNGGALSTRKMTGVKSPYYHSSLAAFRYTLTQLPECLPSVIATRAAYALAKCVSESAITPLVAFFFALFDFFRTPRSQYFRD